MKVIKICMWVGLTLGFSSAFAFECPFQTPGSATNLSKDKVRDLASALTGTAAPKPLTPSSSTAQIKR